MTKFSDLKLDPKVLKAVAEAGYETPTPIQAGAIPPALEGRDVLGIAQTGTGKTASFTLPMITLLGRGRARARMPRSLVLCPTRELAAQVAENFETYAKHTRLTKALLIGGVSFAEQDKLIDRGVDVLIATPGRLLDHFERGKLLLTGVQIMVVDEADRMLDMGFIPDIERIFQLTPFTRQTLFFSATMAPEIERITDTFLHAPDRIEVARQATASETITQRLVEIAPTRRDQAAKQKRELLRALIDAEGEGLTNAIVFCNRKTDVDILAKSLKKHGYDVAAIHGDLDQRHRTKTLDEFRDGKLRLLIASDVAARGLDIPAVSHVFNFDLPGHAEDYVHRIGRTGRAGRTGTAISIATPMDEKQLTAIESLVKQTLPRVAQPEGFALSDAAMSAPRDDRGGRNERRRGRNDDRQRDRDRPREDRAAKPVPVEAPVQEERREDSRQQARPERREDRREDRREERRGRRGDDHRGQPVVGMGDHVPEFMLVPLRSAIEATARDSEDDTVQTVAEKPAPASSPAETQPKAKSRRSRRKSARGHADAGASAPVEATAAEVTVEAMTDAPADVAPVIASEDAAPTNVPVETAEVAAEAPAKPKRSRRKKADPAPAAASDAATPAVEAAVQPEAEATTEAPAKKRATRARKPKAEVQIAPAAEGEMVAEKPKRTRRKKADDAPVDAAVETQASAEAEAVAKPKRTRRKKTAEEPSQDSANAEA
jgi:superfamily II DNA/RNA helicase